ncbi:alpha beta fold family hydrolase [Liquorilactobacillus aquaticus DSM 21051]|uniref:Alpha beta fold family hydrolase n=1 Tax=Liquorilactobacillus aquaticus DSM 21051 TaxID=1423725 RepID=A0A0R2D913_9LACO|nr:alpha/beta hydrolase [Liquorilactobacillus aquaticus]KRM97110.1 alpha beta fold family hydrolase [Liquorilactobacillus aquaticus DSM 21051]
MQKVINGISIHYEIIGQGEPIVFLHGLCLDLNFMKLNYQSNINKNKYQQIYIDIPGMGESPAFSSPQPSGNYLIELITKLLDELKIYHFYLCGHSYGGYLSLGIAYSHPQQVKGLFLTCPVITANSNNRITEKHINIKEDVFKTPANKYAEDFFKMNVLIKNSTWKDYLDRIVVGLEKCDFNFIEKLQGNNYKNYQFQQETKLKNWRSDIPLFLLLGKHDHVVGFKEQAKFATNFQKCNLLVLEKAGHNLPIDQPEILASCTKYFFD